MPESVPQPNPNMVRKTPGADDLGSTVVYVALGSAANLTRAAALGCSACSTADLGCGGRGWRPDSSPHLIDPYPSLTPEQQEPLARTTGERPKSFRNNS